MTGPPSELEPIIDLVRRQASELDAVEVAITWRTATGEVCVDYRASDWLRINFVGERPGTWMLPPDWTTA